MGDFFGKRPTPASWPALLVSLAAVLTCRADVRLLAPAGYLPGIPLLVRVEVLNAGGARDRDLWDAEATLGLDPPAAAPPIHLAATPVPATNFDATAQFNVAESGPGSWPAGRSEGDKGLSTNRVVIRNGLGTALLTRSDTGDATLTATVNGQSAHRLLRDRSGDPVTRLGGTLTGTDTTWSGVVRLTNTVTVPVGHTLTLLANTLVLIDGVASGTAGPGLIVNGAIQSLGTESEPVAFTCSDPALRWGQIRHQNAQPSLYRHTSITRAGRAQGEGHTGQAPVIRPSNSTVTFETCNLTDFAEIERSAPGFGTPGKVMQASGSTVTFDDCVLARARMGPEISGTTLVVTNSHLMDMRGPDDADAIYLQAQSGQTCALRDCVLVNGDDDGIDTLDSTVTVDGCIVRGWNSLFEDAKGISVFNGTTHVRHSLIVDCTVGISAKTTSAGTVARVTVHQSTLAGNRTNVLAQYKPPGAVGSAIDYRITNSVLWGGDAVASDFAPTNFTIVYSDLSEPWPGTGNLEVAPLFVDEPGRNYRLQPGSPCMDAGDPGSPADPDGSRADMGAFPFDGSTPTNRPPRIALLDPPAGATAWAFTSVSVTFTEPVTGLDAADLWVNGRPADLLSGSGAGPYTFTFPEPARGAVLMGWVTGHGIRDLEGDAFAGGPWSCLLAAHTAGVVINEIMYHLASEDPREEYIELFNRGAMAIDLSGWRFSGGVRFAFPPETSIQAGDYLVVVADRQRFAARHPGVTNVVGDWIGAQRVAYEFATFTNVVSTWTNTLGNRGNDLDLDDVTGERVDSVRYADEGDWAVRRRGDPSPLPGSPYRGWVWFTEHDGGGKSLELINPALPNSYGQNWGASLPLHGTPGQPNSIARTNIAPLIVEPRHFPVLPKSTEAVAITARILDESGSSVAVTLHHRVDAATPPAFSATSMADDGRHGDGVAGDGIFGALLPAQPTGAMVEFYLEASDAEGNIRTWPAPCLETNGVTLGQRANALYQVDDSPDAGGQPLYRLILTESERRELSQIGHGTYALPPNPPGTAQSDAQMNGTCISVDGAGTECRYLVGIKNRGHGTRNRQPNNYRVNFSSDHPWKGVGAINLNGQYTHAQVFGAALAQRAGVAGAEARAVQVRVNGTNLALLDNFTRTYGAYAANEVVEGDWAEHHFPSDGNGNAYRAMRDLAPSEFNYRGPDARAYTNTYFKRTNGSEDDWTDLITLLRILGTNDLFTTDHIRTVVNVEQWMAHLALMAIFGNAETGLNSGHNDDYQMYRGIHDPRFSLVYYDLDTILGEGGGNATYAATNATIFGCTVNNGSGAAFSRFLDWNDGVEDFRQVYFQTLARLLETTFSQPQYDALLDQTLGYLNAVDGTVLPRMKTWMTGRRAYIQSVLATNLAPVAPVPVAILTGEPRSPTPFTTATLTISGEDITHYRFRLNDGAWSAELPAAAAIALIDLPHGSTNQVAVIGRNAGGRWQSPLHPTVSRVWTVNTAWPTVRLNEVLARNDAAVDHHGTRPDLIELYNEGADPVALAGLGLTDDPNEPDKFRFPANTVLEPATHLVLIAGAPDGTPGWHLGFALNQDGEGVYLSDRVDRGGARLDSVLFGLQVPDRSLGRIGNGGAWLLAEPTFGSANLAQPLGDVRALKINEFLALGYSPLADDFIELFNPNALPVALEGLHWTDAPIGAPARHPIAPLSFIPGHGYAVFIADGRPEAGANHLNFQLASEQGQIALTVADRSAIDHVVYGPQQPDVPSGHCPNGGLKMVALPLATPGSGNFCPSPPPTPQAVGLIPATNAWHYHTSGADLGTAWRDPDYDEVAWPTGAALFHAPPASRPYTVPQPVFTLLPVPSGQVTYYFRTRFSVPPEAAFTDLQFSHATDDGAIFYLNGLEVGRFNLPAGPITAATVANPAVTDAAWVGPIPIPLTHLVPGTNVFAVELHQNSPTSADAFFGVTLDGLMVTNSPAMAGVVLNEILANNASVRQPDGSTPDWVEIYNPSTNSVDLGGMSLTDSPADSRRWVFSDGSLVGPRGFFLVGCDADRPASATNTGFGLKTTGDEVYLYDADGSLRDYLLFGLQTPDLAVGRVPDGASHWVLAVTTPGQTNVAAPLGSVWDLRVNEWMAAPPAGEDDWFEIYNAGILPVCLGGLYVTDVLNQTTKYPPLPPLSFIGGTSNAFQKFIADNGRGGGHVPFALKASGEAVGLATPQGTLIDGCAFTAQADGVSQGRLPDGTAQVFFFTNSASPGEANYLPMSGVVISEVLAHTDLPLEDAIELHNTTTQPIDLSGWWLSDARLTPRKYQIEPGTVLSPGGYRVLYEFQFNSSDSAAVPFALSSADGDEVYLCSVDVNRQLDGYRTRVEFGPSENGVSFGRWPTSTGVDFVPMSRRTFGLDAPATVEQFRTGAGLPNAYPRVGPVVISEIMFHPPSTNPALEYLELHNFSADPVPLFDPSHPTNTWRLRQGVDFEFPMNVTVPACGALVIVGFDPQTDPASLELFQNTYGTTAPLLGPWRGRLDNGGDRVELQKPDLPQPDGAVPYVLADRVAYDDQTPWPAGADGTGFSLQRVSHALYGNEPLHWTIGPPTLRPVDPPDCDRDADGMPDAWESQFELEPENAGDAVQDADLDGVTNLEEFLSGTAPNDPASRLQLERVSLVNGEVILEFWALAGRSYSLLYRGSVAGGPWLKLLDLPVFPATQPVTINDGAPDAPRFYRLVTPAIP